MQLGPKAQLITQMRPKVVYMIKILFRYSFLYRKIHFKIYTDIIFGLKKQTGNQKLDNTRDEMVGVILFFSFFLMSSSSSPLNAVTLRSCLCFKQSPSDCIAQMAPAALGKIANSYDY